MLPYLTRLLPVADFAAMVAAQAFVQYFVLVTDYGFTITATRQIVFARDDHQQVSRIYSATMSAKLLLAAGSMLICMLLTLTIPALRLNPVITLACMIGILGNALFRCGCCRGWRG
jgi:PST family polysaccharide transporter